MFIDETLIDVKAGNGGNGCFSYAREKYKPKGKPNGGNGGRGGHIIVVPSAQAHTLQDVSYQRFYRGERGDHGRGSDQYGRMGKDTYIKVPIGTIIIDDETGDILHDALEADKEFVLAKGGRGGRGNAALVNRNNPNPSHAEEGKPGQEFKIRMILKVLADVGLVGRPNAGKSTFLSTVSRAHPKIADYPFTTTEPHLGIVKQHDWFESIVVADIPGLIEGSHSGKGMGIRFLRHIERTKVLAIMVEATSEDPVADAEVLISELKEYSPLLADKPKCFILTKTDVLTDEDTPKLPDGWFQLSAVTRTGVVELITEFKRILNSLPDEDS